MMNSPSKQDSPETKRFSIPIEGMSCASCVGRVENALKKVDGISQVEVNLATERATIRSAESLDPSKVVEAIEKTGYSVPASGVELAIKGMTCASCVGRVERALLAVPGVQEATVNLATERANIRGHADLDTLVAAVANAGYEASLASQTGQDSEEVEERKDAELAVLKRDLIIAAVITLPLFVIEMGSHFFSGVHTFIANSFGLQVSWYIQFILASLVLLGPGMRFFKHGVPALLRRAPDMNSLVVLGTSAAWGFSTTATFFPAVLPQGTVSVYYEAAAVIFTPILLGRFFVALP